MKGVPVVIIANVRLTFADTFKTNHIDFDDSPGIFRYTLFSDSFDIGKNTSSMLAWTNVVKKRNRYEWQLTVNKWSQPKWKIKDIGFGDIAASGIISADATITLKIYHKNLEIAEKQADFLGRGGKILLDTLMDPIEKISPTAKVIGKLTGRPQVYVSPSAMRRKKKKRSYSF